MTVYINLTNRLLRRLNEVELSTTDFSSARGIQAAAKDAINSAVFDLNTMQYEWPFNAAEESTSLVVGQTEYSNPVELKSMEWNSFQIIADGTYSTENKRLQYISTDTWYKYHRDRDDDNATNGISIPKYVFPSHGTGWGVSPAPDKSYRITFRYYLHPLEMVNYDDTITGNIIYPNALEPTIIEGALYHMYMLKDNPESAQLAKANFMQAVADLKSQYINKFSGVVDTRVQFGGGASAPLYKSINASF